MAGPVIVCHGIEFRPLESPHDRVFFAIALPLVARPPALADSTFSTIAALFLWSAVRLGLLRFLVSVVPRRNATRPRPIRSGIRLLGRQRERTRRFRRRRTTTTTTTMTTTTRRPRSKDHSPPRRTMDCIPVRIRFVVAYRRGGRDDYYSRRRRPRRGRRHGDGRRRGCFLPRGCGGGIFPRFGGSTPRAGRWWPMSILVRVGGGSFREGENDDVRRRCRDER
mmetsp:Transcript_25123/g.50297  ORF Transcript_25123/g.50297 Transcript_25123/m.50297 type:complete len:223 (-) Transcript_25123:24-692(-)